MPLGKEEILKRYGSTATSPQDVENEHIVLRAWFVDLALYLDTNLPDGRAKQCVETALESASMWAHKSLAGATPQPKVIKEFPIIIPPGSFGYDPRTIPVYIHDSGSRRIVVGEGTVCPDGTVKTRFVAKDAFEKFKEGAHHLWITTSHGIAFDGSDAYIEIFKD